MLCLTLAALRTVDWNFFFFFFAHSSDKLPAVNLLPKPRAQKPLKVQDLSSLTSCVVLCLCPKANTLGSIFFFSRTHFSQSHCMCSVVVVESMVASTVTSVQPGHDNLFFVFVLFFEVAFSKTKYLAVWPYGYSHDHRIPNSATQFYTILIFQKKK